MSTIVVEPGGTIKLIYEDDLREVLQEGEFVIKRVSHVEPTEDGQWTADLCPVGGPTLGPFPTRAEAINAEIDWISTHTLWSNLSIL